MEAKITTKADIERADRARHIRYGVAMLVAVGLLAMVPGAVHEEPEPVEGVDIPTRKAVLVKVTPAHVPGTSVVLVSEDGEQQVIPANQATELRLQGQVQWTVSAPGFKAQHGRFEVAFAGDPGEEVQVEATLAPSIERPRNRRRFGRLPAGGSR